MKMLPHDQFHQSPNENRAGSDLLDAENGYFVIIWANMVLIAMMILLSLFF